jgi:hypothetical protein
MFDQVRFLYKCATIITGDADADFGQFYTKLFSDCWPYYHLQNFEKTSVLPTIIALDFLSGEGRAG